MYLILITSLYNLLVIYVIYDELIYERKLKTYRKLLKPNALTMLLFKYDYTPFILIIDNTAIYVR